MSGSDGPEQAAPNILSYESIQSRSRLRWVRLATTGLLRFMRTPLVCVALGVSVGWVLHCAAGTSEDAGLGAVWCGVATGTVAAALSRLVPISVLSIEILSTALTGAIGVGMVYEINDILYERAVANFAGSVELSARSVIESSRGERINDYAYWQARQDRDRAEEDLRRIHKNPREWFDGNITDGRSGYAHFIERPEAVPVSSGLTQGILASIGAVVMKRTASKKKSGNAATR